MSTKEEEKEKEKELSMPIAAVPRYLGETWTTASPGMKFGFYLPVWTALISQKYEVNDRAGRHRKGKNKDRKNKVEKMLDEMLLEKGMDATISFLEKSDKNPLPKIWDKNNFFMKNVWENLTDLNKEGMNDIDIDIDIDIDRGKAILKRQRALACSLGESIFTFEGKSMAPFSTGLGNEHPLENGFAFLNPYGLPYLAGSGVKGVLRQAARELAGLGEYEWEKDSKWNGEYEWNQATIDALFGKEDSDNAQQGALQFWDVIPKLDKLQVEVMTPHQGHYYRDGEAPHDSGQPIPIFFLSVPPESNFSFNVVCNRPFLRRLDLKLKLGLEESWKVLLEDAFKHAFEWLGFGAKTAVGYGAMERDLKAEQKRAQQAALKSAVEGLPDDAVWLVELEHSEAWQDKSQWMVALQTWLGEQSELTSKAQERLKVAVDHHYPGLLSNPNATRGKKNKPKFRDTQRKLAEHVLALCP